MTPSRSARESTAAKLRLVHPDEDATAGPASAPDAEAASTHLGVDQRLTDAMNAFALLRFQNSRLIDRVSESLRITPTDFRALIYVSGHDEVTPKQIAEHLGLTTGAMTALVDRVEAAGLAERAANPSDRRSLLIQLTDAGRDAVTFGGRVYGAAFASAIADEHIDIVTQVFTALSEQLGDAADRFTRS